MKRATKTSSVPAGPTGISPEARTESSLSEREQLLSSINANMSGTCVYRTVYHVDGRMECAYVSPNVEALIGIPAADFLADARQVFGLIHPDDLPGFRQALTESLSTGAKAAITARVRHAKGGEIWAQFRSQLSEHRADGAQVRDGVVVDVTSIKAAEAELLMVRQRLEMALSASRTCIWDENCVSGRITLDPMWAVMRGYSPCATVNRWRALLPTVHPDDRRAVMIAGQRAVRGDTDDYCIEHRVATAAGSWIWIISRGRVTERDANGRPPACWHQHRHHGVQAGRTKGNRNEHPSREARGGAHHGPRRQLGPTREIRATFPQPRRKHQSRLLRG